MGETQLELRPPPLPVRMCRAHFPARRQVLLEVTPVFRARLCVLPMFLHAGKILLL